jgi:hypothetical protein
MFSVELDADNMWGMEAAASMPTLIGDFYHEPDTVTRGLSLYYGEPEFSAMCDTCSFGKACYEETEAKTRSFRADFRFEHGDEATPIPNDGYFQLEVTTIDVVNSSAVEIGNHIIDFLHGASSTLITKVNQHKFTIKAEVCIDDLSCVTKIRIYKRSADAYAVEMQRRSGDSVAFQKLYNNAAAYLASPLTYHGTFSDASPAPEFERSHPSEKSLAPLLDLASSDCMHLQAEAAQSLGLALIDANMLAELCMPHVVVAFRALLQLACFSIIRPLAGVLQCLATVPEAQAVLADQDVLQGMILNIWATTTGPEASKMLAQIANRSINRIGKMLPEPAQSTLTCALSKQLSHYYHSSLDQLCIVEDSTVYHMKDSLELLGGTFPSPNAMMCF